MQESELSPSFSKLNLPPLKLLAFAVVIGLVVEAGMILLATSQPWLGLKLVQDPDSGAVRVIQSRGPASHLPAGSILTAISANGIRMDLQAGDLTIEPDGAMGTYENYQAFLQRQDQLSQILQTPQLVFTTATGESHTIRPQTSGRPFHTLPVEFWVQLTVGLVAWLVSASVFALRPKAISARFLLLSGMATLMFASFAAVYTTRELALNATAFRWLGDLNFLGGSLFAASFIALLLYYPRPITRGWAGSAVVLVYIGWYLAQQSGWFESMTFARRFLVVIGVAFTFVLAAIQWVRTARDPVARAALQWFLLSWMTGTICFVFFILLPQLFGVDTSHLQGYSFLLFLLVYCGLAFGILHYRLFDLGDWWRKIILWTLTVFLLVILDLFFVMQLHLSIELSLSISLLVCSLVWLPLRALVWKVFFKGTDLRPQDLFSQVMSVALPPTGQHSQSADWNQLLQQIFRPLYSTPLESSPKKVHIADEGTALCIPAIHDIDATRLEYANGGNRLFNPQDVTLAQEVTTMLGHAIESRSAYEQGIAKERTRIARDLHDNIGGQLMTALQQKNTGPKNETIRNTMSDLRTIINESLHSAESIEVLFAELRYECAERLTAAGISLDWPNQPSFPQLMSKNTHFALRSCIREAISNVIRHSAASKVHLEFGSTPVEFSIRISDDGQGFEPDSDSNGNGLASMRDRIAGIGGTLTFLSTRGSTCLHIQIPLTHADCN